MIWRCWAVIPPLVGSPSSLVPLPTRDNMQAKLDAPLGCSRKGNRCGIGRRRIRAYSLISLYRGLFYSGFYRIGAALIPMGARPRLSPRPLRPRRSGPPFLQAIVTFACRECGYQQNPNRLISNRESPHEFTFGRRVSASAVPVAGRPAVYPCN
jgi:hypothetical protein